MINLGRLLGLTLLMIFSSSVSARMGVVDLSHAEFAEKVSAVSDAVIIDVRSAEEFAAGRVPGAVNIAHGDILENISLLDEYRGKDIIFYCRSGGRVGRVTNVLVGSGFTDEKAVYHLDGDMLDWEAAEQPIEK